MACNACKLVVIQWICLLEEIVSFIMIGTSETLVIKNASQPDLVIDCPYQLSINDEYGFVLHWFYNSIPNPIYQWVPFNEPEAISAIRPRLDFSYTPFDNRYHKHRALRFVNLSTDLSGIYTCRVSSFSDEKSIVRKIVIYVSPADLEVRVDEVEENIKVSCETGKVFPVPDVKLNKIIYEERKQLPITRKETVWSKGAYNLSLETTVPSESLFYVTGFECQLKLPDTELEMTKIIKYVPNCCWGDKRHP